MKKLIKKIENNLNQDIPNNHGLSQHHKDRGDYVSEAYFQGRRDYAKKIDEIIHDHLEVCSDEPR